MKSFGKQGSGDGEFKIRTSICISSDERFIVVVEYENSRIQVFTMDVEPVFKFGDSGPEGWIIRSFAFFYVDKFIVTDLENNCVKVFDKRGQFLYKFGEKGNSNEQLNQPWLMC